MQSTINLAMALIIALFIGAVVHRIAYFIGSNSLIIREISNFIEKVFIKIFSNSKDK